MPKKPTIAPRELAVAFFGGATLVFTAWSYAGVMSWALHTMLVGGLLTLACSVLPIPTLGHSGLRRCNLWLNGICGEHGSGKNVKLLAASPFFWFWTAFLVYLCLQALNPSMIQLKDQSGRWWIETVEPPFGANWPSSISASFEPMNPWRAIELHLAAGSLACGLWVGLRRRRVVLAVLWVFVISGIILGMVAILQHLSGVEKVLWTIASENEHFWGSFFYRNHGAAYLNWVLVATGCLYFYHAKRSADSGQSGGPHFLCTFGFVLTTISVGLALSRGGIIFAILLNVAFFTGVLLQYLRGGRIVRQSLAISLVISVLFAVGGMIGYRTIDWVAIQERFGDIGATIEDVESDQRTLSSLATWEMAQDRLWMGWGAGSFRYVFPKYQKEHPKLWHRYYHPKNGWVGRKFFRYAHNDILQFLAEYGVIGCVLLSAALFSLLATSIFGLARDSLMVIFLIIGCCFACVHACADFIFSCPAYWVAWVGVIALMKRMTFIEINQ